MKIKFNKIINRHLKNYRKYFHKVKPYKQNKIERKSVKISAYLSIYNDDDFIISVLDKIKDYVDELIVVDGAYKWMALYLEKLNIDPLRSNEKIYKAIIGSEIPYRLINKLWESELEKRVAGYEACQYRYRMRIDADEIMYFNDEYIETFLGSGCAVAQMEFPLYLAPGLVLGYQSKQQYKYPEVCVLFDSHKISAAKHLEYLWLVMAGDTSYNNKSRTYPIYEKPIGICAHLSVWRTSYSALSRAAFYSMNWIRRNGIPWVKKNKSAKLGLADLFSVIAPDQLNKSLVRTHTAFGVILDSPMHVIMPSPLPASQESDFIQFYDAFKKWMVDLNAQAMGSHQFFIFNEYFYIDITNYFGVRFDGNFEIELSDEVNEVTASLTTLKKKIPFFSTKIIECEIEKNLVLFSIPESINDDSILRQYIGFKICRESENICGYFKIRKKQINKNDSRY